MKKPKHISKDDWEDLDSPPLTDEMLSRMRPVEELHPEIPRRVRGAQRSPKKVPVSIRLSPEVIDYFKSTGKGWQTRLDDALREYVNSR